MKFPLRRRARRLAALALAAALLSLCSGCRSIAPGRMLDLSLVMSTGRNSERAFPSTGPSTDTTDTTESTEIANR